jgi:hypothetical protein
VANIRAIRQALDGWGVTTVVVPDQPALPSYEHGRSVSYAVGLFTAALGTAPSRQSDAWVWSNADRAGPPVPLSSGVFTACTGGTGGAAVAACVLRSR